MKGILTLALMSAVAHLSHGVGSVAIDIKNCTRTNPMYVGLASEKNLTQDLQNLGYHFTPSSTLMAYSVFDKNHIVQMFTDKQTYFFVYGDSDGDYICAQNITFERFNELITGCEQPFVLNVDLDSCLILSKNDSTVGTITKESIKRRLVGTTYDDNTKVTEVLLDSNQKSFQLYSVKSTPPKHFGTDPHRTNPKPRLISQSEYNAYMEICKDRTTA